jgi:hypothetical protein
MFKQIACLSAAAAFCSSSSFDRFSYDRKLSPYMGADDLITSYRGLAKFQDVSIGPAPTYWTRLLEMLAIYYPLSNYLATTQHEVFGHGFRIRSLGRSVASVNNYKIEVSFPYSGYASSLGSTSFTHSIDWTRDHHLSVSIAGLEAEAVMTRKLKKRWVASRSIEKRLSVLYAPVALSFTDYALSLLGTEDSGHDIADTIALWNELYPNNIATGKYVKNIALLNYLDPMLWFSVRGVWNYLSHGKSASVPMFKTKGLDWLPSYRADLTPFGVGHWGELYICIDKELLYFYAMGCDRGGAFGLGFERRGLLHFRKTTFDVEFDFWKQPRLALDLCAQRSGKNMWGARTVVTMNVKLGDFIWFEQFGFKSEGYYQGESLDQVLIVRMGLGARF